MSKFRTGFGYDVHRLVDNRDLILGGVNIPFEKGLLGHSDADVLIHALIDALLGAAALGDIGTHFPDNDSDFKDISSLVLLKKTSEMLANKAYLIGNIDTTLVLENPKIKNYIPEIIDNISKSLAIDKDQVSVKATTTEGLGFTGVGEGVSAYATVLIYTD